MATKTKTAAAPLVTGIDIENRIVGAVKGSTTPMAAKDIATASGLAYSTVTQYVRAMVTAGTLTAVKVGRANLVAAPGTVAHQNGQVEAGQARGRARRAAEDARDAARIESKAPAKAAPAVKPSTDKTAPAAKISRRERAAAADGSALRAADHVNHDHVKAPRKRTPAKAAQSPVAASTPPAAPDVPAKAAKGGGGKLDTVLGRLRTVRPEPPAAEPKAKRVRAKAAPAEVRTWKHGELRDTVLTWFRQNAKKGATPGECARAIKAHQQPVATNCARLTVAGSLALVLDKDGNEVKPMAYRPA